MGIQYHQWVTPTLTHIKGKELSNCPGSQAAIVCRWQCGQWWLTTFQTSLLKILSLIYTIVQAMTIMLARSEWFLNGRRTHRAVSSLFVYYAWKIPPPKSAIVWMNLGLWLCFICKSRYIYIICDAKTDGVLSCQSGECSIIQTALLDTLSQRYI
jgi:hypothetical protein